MRLRLQTKIIYVLDRLISLIAMACKIEWLIRIRTLYFAPSKQFVQWLVISGSESLEGDSPQSRNLWISIFSWISRVLIKDCLSDHATIIYPCKIRILSPELDVRLFNTSVLGLVSILILSLFNLSSCDPLSPAMTKGSWCLRVTSRGPI